MVRVDGDRGPATGGRRAASPRRCPGLPATVFLAALFAVACGGGDGESADVGSGHASAPTGPPPANLLLVTLDTTRADRLGCYGYAGAATPTFDALAAEGVLFERAWAPAPITLPSHATVLTGLPPAAHGVHNNGTYELPAAAETLAEILSARGFATAAFVSAFVLDRRYGLDQGFDRYGDDLTAGNAPLSDLEVRSRPAEQTVDAAVSWLEDHHGRPFFLWLHLFDPHLPYRLEGDLARRFAASPYDGEIARTDREVGRLLAALERLGLARDTAVVVTADHGESLGEHGEDTHGLFVYDSTLRVPLILHHPGSLPAGRRPAANAGLVDVAPTVLELLGVPVPEAMAGRSLLAAVGDGAGRGGGDAGARPLLVESVLPAESYGLSPLSGVVAGDHKYIAAPLPELYDLAADPDESDNLWDEGGEVSRRLVRVHRAALEDLAAPGEATRALDAEEEGALRSLGYVFRGGGAAGGRDGAARGSTARDPKRWVELVARVKRATGLVAEGRYAEARPLLETSLREDPESYDALWMLGELELKQGRPRRAEELFERAAGLRPDRAQALLGLGKIARAQGRAEAAREYFERATGDPESADAHLHLAVAWLDEGRPERAVAVLEAAAERFPYAPKVPYMLALVHEQRGDADAARRQVARALALAPDDPAASGLARRLGLEPG